MQLFIFNFYEIQHKYLREMYWPCKPDFQHFCFNIMHCYRRYCPSVITSDASVYSKPKSQLSLLLKPKNSVKRTSYIEIHTNTDPSWLYPIILPSIFPALFELYKIHYTENDDKFNQLMVTLGERTDEELCKLLEITQYVCNKMCDIRMYSLMLAILLCFSTSTNSACMSVLQEDS